MTDETGKWTEETVGGHPCDVYMPPEHHAMKYVVIYLHGVDLNRLIDKQAFCEQFDKHGLAVVAPMTQRSWWSDRICPDFDSQITAEQHVLQAVVPFIKTRFDAIPPRIALLGTSMGGQGALRLAYKHPNTFPVVAAISPAIDYQCYYAEDELLQEMYAEAEAVRQDTATLHIHPLNWPRHQFFCCCLTDSQWRESSERLRMKLWSLGVPHTADLETTGGGHGFQYYNLMAETAVGFLAERLEQERRRVV